MAAPAGGGGSAVSVLAPNGRRHTVKVTPSTVLLQVLEDTCRRQDFNPCEYDLKFQRSVLDLSLQWRFANLPNNAKLEMVPASRSREGPENMVRIALQLDDGSRLQDSFCSGQSLWELLSHFAQTRFVMKCCDPVDKTPGSLGSSVSSVSAGQAAASTSLPLESGELSRGDLSRWEDADTSGPCFKDTQEKQSTRAPAPAPFVPFSGGGQRLGGPPGPTRPLTSSSVTLPKTLSSPGGPSKPKKSKSGQDPRQEQEQEQEQEPEPPVDLEPVDREPVVCHPDLEERLQAWPAELPDDFFELTVDDVRRRLAQLKSERKRLEEAPLVTKAFREAQIKEKLERYPKVALRVLFPDRYVLQGFFRPSETVGDLRDFVRSHLGNPELSFYLFITPPKTVLDDHTRTLFQALPHLDPLKCSSLTNGLAEGGMAPAVPAPALWWMPRLSWAPWCRLPPRQTSSRPLWYTSEPRSRQVSTWSLACWSTPSPHLQPTCWWPGACPGSPGPLPHCQPLTLHLSLNQLLRRGHWVPPSPSQGQPSL
ncbi:tether containing UBX domain for GLUT4 isoform X3 [Chlorocebus sabaeus]|uniref:tether containing UBX domain for GLUT4 isoform X3 n=1 Tax=Chlorocebus sabaeus TaxID=60711 RepID=UPI003BF9E129